MQNCKTSQAITIGPLIFKANTPSLILSQFHSSLHQLFAGIHNKKIQTLNFDQGRFNSHLQALSPAQDWIQKYQIQYLKEFRCGQNILPDLQSITIFYLPRRVKLMQQSCFIESLQYLSDCFFPNLHTLVLFNNHIISLRSLRRCRFPFLNSVIADSNNISEINCLSQMRSPFIFHLQLHNNKIVDFRPIFKLNGQNLNEIRFQNNQYIITEQLDALANLISQKFPNV